MSLQRDYLLRIIEAFAQAMARILTLRRAGQHEAAKQEIAAAARSLFGVDLGLLEAVGAGPVAAQLGHPEKVEALAKLLDERAGVERDRGDEAAAGRWAARAAALRAHAAARPR
jgi:TPR repeat protein